MKLKSKTRKILGWICMSVTIIPFTLFAFYTVPITMLILPFFIIFWIGLDLLVWDDKEKNK